MNTNLIFVANIEAITKKNNLCNGLTSWHFNVTKYDALLYFLGKKTFIDIETGKIYTTRHKGKVGKKFVNITSLKYLSEYFKELETYEKISRKKILILSKDFI